MKLVPQKNKQKTNSTMNTKLVKNKNFPKKNLKNYVLKDGLGLENNSF